MIGRLVVFSLLSIAAVFAGPAEVVEGLLLDPKVQQALKFVRVNEPKIIEERKEACTMSAWTKAGNVLGQRAGPTGIL